jgi:hypothetical protein
MDRNGLTLEKTSLLSASMPSTDPTAKPLTEVTAKIRPVDHEKAGELAQKYNSTRKEIISAWRTMFESAPAKRQRAALDRVRKLHPMPYPRIGRGNRAA